MTGIQVISGKIASIILEYDFFPLFMQSPPADIVASGRDLFVRFTTNGQNPTGDYQYTGFRATFDS